MPTYTRGCIIRCLAFELRSLGLGGDARGGSGQAGTPWSDSELDAIVADHFAMLDAELSRRPYVKRQHSAALMTQIGRSHRSVEFKHQNISAVLEELGLPWIPGYKPKPHYQGAIFDAIGRYLSTHGDGAHEQGPARLSGVAEGAEIFISAPPPRPTVSPAAELALLLRKFDPVERDFRNRALGKAGERFVFELERRRLTKVERSDLVSNIRWVAAEDGDGAGYDILSFEPDARQRLIEVKTTNGAARTPFFLTRNERETATEHANSWKLYRVHVFAQTPRIITIHPPLEASLHFRPETWRASFL